MSATSFSSQSTQSTQSSRPAISFTFRLTDAKIKKLAHLFFGVLTLLIANAFAPSIISIPFYLLTVACAHGFFRVKDYDNPAKLEDYRERAKGQTFEQVVRDHGLANVARHSILTAEQLTSKLSEHLKTSSLTEIVHLYEQIQKLGCYSSSWVHSIFSCCIDGIATDLKPSYLFSMVGIKTLEKHKLLSARLQDAYERYQRLQSTREQHVHNLDAWLVTEWSNIVDTLKRELDRCSQLSLLQTIIPLLEVAKTPKEIARAGAKLLANCPENAFCYKPFETEVKRVLDQYYTALEKDTREFDAHLAAMDRNYCC